MRDVRAMLRGAGSVMDLAGGGRYRLYAAMMARRSGLAADWAAVGGDLRRAMDGAFPPVPQRPDDGRA